MKFLTLIALFVTGSLHAHPVIFEGGTVVSSSNMEGYSDNQILYSYSSKWAAGVNHWRFTKGNENTEMGLARLNHLLWRKNGEDFQSNIYLLSGIGVIDSEIDKRRTEEVYMAGIEVDWETRNLFAALKHYQFASPRVSDLAMTQGRLGFSPKETPYDQLQTWFMVQAMYTGDIDRTVSITPLVRFFYHNVLWEMGASSRGEWLLNLMVHI